MHYDRDGLYFLGRTNIRYHEGQELRYERFLNWTSFSSLLLSSAAFVSLTPLLPAAWQPFLSASFALIVTTLNGAVLALGMLSKYTLHGDLKKEWMRFIARLENMEDARLPEMVQAFHDLNTREPAGNDADFAKAEAATRTAMGYPSAPARETLA